MFFVAFLAACTAERFFRIDRHQEHLHYVVDICNDDLYILDAADEANRDESVNSCLLTEADARLEIPGQRSASIDVGASGEDNNNTIVLLKSASEDDGRRSSEGDEKSEENGNRTAGDASDRTDDSSPGRDVCRDLDDDLIKGERDDDEPIASPERARDVAFLEAAKVGDLEMLKRLHEQGSSLTTAEANGMTALHYAARSGYENVVQFLLKESHALMEVRDE